MTKEAFDFKVFLLRDRKGRLIRRIRGAKAVKNSRFSNPRNRTIDEVERVQGSQGHRSLFRSRLQTCPVCKGTFRYPKVVGKDIEHIRLICPMCNAELGKIDRERLQAALDE